jgi:hypothetical protein
MLAVVVVEHKVAQVCQQQVQVVQVVAVQVQ